LKKQALPHLLAQPMPLQPTQHNTLNPQEATRSFIPLDSINRYSKMALFVMLTLIPSQKENNTLQHSLPFTHSSIPNNTDIDTNDADHKDVVAEGAEGAEGAEDDDANMREITMLSRQELCEVLFNAPYTARAKQWCVLRDHCNFYNTFSTQDFIDSLRHEFPTIDQKVTHPASYKKVANDYWQDLLHRHYQLDKHTLTPLFNTLGIPERMHIRFYFYLQSHFTYHKHAHSKDNFSLLIPDALRLLPELIYHGELDYHDISWLLHNTFSVPVREPVSADDLMPPQQYMWQLWAHSLHIPKLTAQEAHHRVTESGFRLSSSARWLEEDWMLWAGDMTPLHWLWDHVLTYLENLNNALSARHPWTWSSHNLIITWVTEPWHSGSHSFITRGSLSGYRISDSLSPMITVYPQQEKKIMSTHSAWNKIDISSRSIHGVLLSSYFGLWHEWAFTKRSFIYTHPWSWKKVMCDVGILYHLWHFDISVLPQSVIE